MSLAQLRKIDETGVTFQSHIDGSTHVLTPERSIEIQGLLGSDIQMQLDECVKLPCTDEEAERAMQLSPALGRALARSPSASSRARRCSASSRAARSSGCASRAPGRSSTMDLKGYAIGGLAVGEPQEVMLRMIETVEPHLPDEKPRYLMGVGTPDDIVEAVRRGVDMFDCVMPTRAGRHGLVFTRFGQINLRNARHADDHAAARPGIDLPGGAATTAAPICIISSSRTRSSA